MTRNRVASAILFDFKQNDGLIAKVAQFRRFWLAIFV